jgi:uncharacterized repeat protein (TIGR01451 family)
MKLALLLFAPSPALAQFVPGTPYIRTSAPNTWAPCTSPTVLDTDTDDDEFAVAIPFSFKFYESFPATMTVGANGALAFPQGLDISLGNQSPGSSTLNAFIAAMWDDLRLYSANGGLIGWQVNGTAPNRTLEICYQNISLFGASGFTFNFTFRLFEGLSGRIEIDYGPLSGTANFSATMGMEDDAGARPILFHPSMCTTNCTLAELTTFVNTRLTLVEDPGVEIVGAGITAPEIAFLGAETSVDVVVSNLNANPVGPFAIEVDAGDGTEVQNPVTVGSLVITLPGFSTQTLPVPVVFPASLGERSVYLALEADALAQVNEVNENNNRATSATPVRLLTGNPDLAVTVVTHDAGASVAAGGTLTVSATVRNVGGEPAPATPMAIVLSSNPVITPQDVELDRFTVTLAPGESATATRTVTLPADTNSGVYFVGAVADPDNALVELSESNNGLASPGSIMVQGGTLDIVTTELPRGYVGETYTALLAAVGGDGTYAWSLVQGTWPDGLGLVPGSGEIFGRPRAVEIQTVTVRVTSGAATAEATFTIEVIDPIEPLTIVTRTLAPGVVGQPYDFMLIATGGTGGAASWSESGLPSGLSLSPAGRITGTPGVAGMSSVIVTATVGADAASRTLELVVRENANLSIVPAALSTARFGDPYDAALSATGGVPPINWIVESGALPDGLTLGLDGRIAGTPMAVGLFRFVVQARDSAPGALNAKDENAFELEVADVGGFTIVTASLEDAVVNQGYDVAIEAEGGLMPYEWVIDEGRIPEGLLGSANPSTGQFRIAGQPLATGGSNMLVKVTDSQGRKAIRALTLRVVDPIVTTEGDAGGCGCDAGRTRSGSFFGVVIATLVAILARKRRSVLLALPFVTITGEARAQTQVPGTPYQIATTPITYAPLSSPTILWTTADDDEATVPLPFAFKYYDGTVTQITIGENGAIAMVGNTDISFSNQTPGSGSFNNYVAAVWDDLSLETSSMGYIGYQIEGTAPTRTFTVEYRHTSDWLNPALRMSFQIRLFEGGSGRIEIDYAAPIGTGDLTATMGMEDQNGARPILFNPVCSSNCTLANLQALSNRRVSVVQDPGIEIVATGVGAPEFAFLGALSSIPVSVENLHGTVLGPFTIEVRAGTGPDATGSVPIGALGVTLQAFQQQQIPIPCIFPQSLGETTVYVAVVADANGALVEVDEMNNRFVSPTPTRLLTGAADLIISSVQVDRTNVQAGETLTVYTTVTNIGGEPVSNAEVSVVLSSNPVISPQDLELDDFTVSLMPQQSITTTSTPVLSSINSGAYWVGGLADSAGAVDELSEANNGRAIGSPISVSGGGLAITTTALPGAIIRETYTALLAAVGGEGPYQWQVVAGMLPSGIGIVPASGELFGRASAPEMQTFTVRVTSGNETDEETFTIVASDPDEPLTIVTRAIPPAVAGQEYGFRMVSTGAAAGAMLTWRADGLPGGLAIDQDGLLAGAVAEALTATITVTVTDGVETATRELTLEVRDNVNLLIVPALLPSARYGEPYRAELLASGGIPPLTWLVEVGQLPAGVDLSTDGVLSGTPMEVGSFRLVIAARDSGAGAQAARDVNTFVLEVLDAGAFAIATESLPRGVIDTGYDARVTATGGLPPYEWTVEGRVPAGLLAIADTTTNELRINGVPTAAGVTNLEIGVRDSEGRTARRALAVIVDETAPAVATPPTDEGCGCTGLRAPLESSGSGLSILAWIGILLAVSARLRSR